LFNELKQRKTIESDDLPDLLRDLMIPPPPAYPQKPARRQQHCPSNFIYYPMPVAYFAPEMFGYTVISPTMHK
jgi:hypothetical protein